MCMWFGFNPAVNFGNFSTLLTLSFFAGETSTSPKFDLYFFFLSNFQHWNFWSHFSRELWGLEDWNLVHTWTVGRCIMYTRIRLLLLVYPFISSFFFLSNFQHWNFLSHFSRELWGLEDWKLVHLWTVGRCIMYTRFRLLLLAYSSLYFFIFLSLQFSNIKIFVTLFSGLEDWNLVQMWIAGWCILYTGIRLLLLIHPIISSFVFLSNYQTLKIFVTFFSGTVRSRRLKLGTHVDSGQMYRVYRNQAAAYLSLYFFIFLSLQFSNIKIFRHTVLTNCEA